MGLRHTVAVATLLPLVVTGLIAGTPSPANAAPRVRAHLSAPRPPRVTNLAPYKDGSTVTLGWHNPAAALFRRVVVRYARGSAAPATPSDGTPVRVATPRATTAPLRALTPGRRYSAAVWVRDAMGRLSPRAATTFVVPRVVHTAVGTVSGTVVDGRGAPLSGVSVFAYSQDDFGDVVQTVTDASGEYHLSAPAGRVFIAYGGADAEGGHSDSTGYVSDFRSVTAVAHRDVSINVTLHAGAEITGRVIDDNGDPVAGIASYALPATSYVSPDANDSGVDFMSYSFEDGGNVTGQDGTFQLRGVPAVDIETCFQSGAGDFGWYSYSATGGAARCTDPPQQLHAGQLLDVGNTTLTPVQDSGGSIAGRVVDASGEGVTGAAVYVARVGRRRPAAYASTDSNGRYEFDGLDEGEYRVCTDSMLFAPSDDLGYLSHCRSKHVTVVAGQTARRERIVVRAGGALSGVVRAADGTPVAGVGVSVGRGYGTTDATGHWTVGGLRSGRYRVCAIPENTRVAGHPSGVLGRCTNRHATIAVRRGRYRIGADLTLPDAAAIRGTVVAGSGRPIRGADVEVIGANPRIDDFQSAETGPRGHFVVTGLHAGKYEVCFDDEPLVGGQFSACAHRSVRTHLGHVANFGTEDFGATGAVAATVDDAAGTPLNGVDVAVLKPCHKRFMCDSSPLVGHPFRVVASWVTERDGTVRLPQLRPGAYRVCLFGYLAAPAQGATPPTGYSDSCTSDAFDVQVAADQDTTVTGTLAPAGAVSGTLTDTTGAPVAGVLVHVSDSAVNDVPNSFAGSPSPFDDPAFSRAVTAADGSYVVRSVAPGSQTVCVRPDDEFPKRDFERQCYGGQPGGTTGTPVAVTANEVTPGIDFSVQRTG